MNTETIYSSQVIDCLKEYKIDEAKANHDYNKQISNGKLDLNYYTDLMRAIAETQADAFFEYIKNELSTQDLFKIVYTIIETEDKFKENEIDDKIFYYLANKLPSRLKDSDEHDFYSQHRINYCLAVGNITRAIELHDKNKEKNNGQPRLKGYNLNYYLETISNAVTLQAYEFLSHVLKPLNSESIGKLIFFNYSDNLDDHNLKIIQILSTAHLHKITTERRELNNINVKSNDSWRENSDEKALNKKVADLAI
ncbi:MAG: hypothetical protein J0H68_04160 [Sphingobacteriia bacterium]|nr:hypothetical protein [Sphingobacteriia bacterium]